MELLQTKQYLLRLNREQAHNTLANWNECETSVDEASLPLYRSLHKDVIDQLAQQGLTVKFDSPVDVDIEAKARAAELLSQLEMTTQNPAVPCDVMISTLKIIEELRGML
ncbi:hypothetical protein ACK8P5_26050 (plasmid) [Paenibacillus sp. EC2-1]|uniref:hypothetical protein n=1 Tax=Paenibacillus sp. EC2-1 TaxID=3388665 RepID=UPI003BEEDD46